MHFELFLAALLLVAAPLGGAISLAVWLRAARPADPSPGEVAVRRAVWSAASLLGAFLIFAIGTVVLTVLADGTELGSVFTAWLMLLFCGLPVLGPGLALLAVGVIALQRGDRAGAITALTGTALTAVGALAAFWVPGDSPSALVPGPGGLDRLPWLSLGSTIFIIPFAGWLAGSVFTGCWLWRARTAASLPAPLAVVAEAEGPATQAESDRVPGPPPMRMAKVFASGTALLAVLHLINSIWGLQFTSRYVGDPAVNWLLGTIINGPLFLLGALLTLGSAAMIRGDRTGLKVIATLGIGLLAATSMLMTYFGYDLIGYVPSGGPLEPAPLTLTGFAVFCVPFALIFAGSAMALAAMWLPALQPGQPQPNPPAMNRGAPGGGGLAEVP